MWNTNRFFAELEGTYGEYWQKDAQRRLDKIVADYNNGELLIDEDGVGTWKRSDNVIPDECAFYAEYMGLPINREATAKARDEELDMLIEEYREHQDGHEPTDEELFEMRAAFGTGTTVVDVITGRKYHL